MVSPTEYRHHMIWAQRGLKTGSNLGSINTRTGSWRIIDGDCAAIATRQRGEGKKNVNEVHKWPGEPRCISGELHDQGEKRGETVDRNLY